MPQAYDESHWYGRMGWPDLRASITRLAIEVLANAKEDAAFGASNASEMAGRLVASTIAAIEARREAQYAAQRKGWISSEHSYVASRWDYALALFGETETLTAALEKDFNILAGRTNRDVSPERALGEALRQFLETARRRQSPATEDRQKTWEAISRISSRIIAEHGPGQIIDRCSEEHMVEVQRKLLELYPDSKNLALKKMNTVRAYFYEFSPDSRQAFSPEDDASGLGGSISQILSEELGEKPRLEHCLSELQQNDPESWETLIIKYELDELPKTRMGEYMAGKGLTRHRFEKLVQQAIEHMRNCFENTTNFRFGRGQ
jgi:hypothetical protein